MCVLCADCFCGCNSLQHERLVPLLLGKRSDEEVAVKTKKKKKKKKKAQPAGRAAQGLENRGSNLDLSNLGLGWDLI